MNNYFILHGSFGSPFGNWFSYLRKEIERNRKKTNIFIFIIILLIIAIAVGVFIYLDNNGSTTSYDDSYNYNNNSSYQQPQETKQCVKWKNTWNISSCQWVQSSGCQITGQECVEWK